MKLTCLATIVCLAGWLANACATTNLSAGEDALKLVRLKFDAFNAHDASAIEGLYAADAVLHSPDYPELAGNSQIAGTYRRLFDAIPDAKDNVQTLGSSGAKVYAEFVLTGHLKGTTTAVNVRIMSVYTVQAGRIISDSTYYDRKSP
jgi:ketosteroid isomerase-like protein